MIDSWLQQSLHKLKMKLNTTSLLKKLNLKIILIRTTNYRFL